MAASIHNMPYLIEVLIGQLLKLDLTSVSLIEHSGVNDARMRHPQSTQVVLQGVTNQDGLVVEELREVFLHLLKGFGCLLH